MNATTIKPGTEVKILQVSNPQHRKRIGKTGRVSNEKSNYHGHKNTVPVQIGRDICWMKPEHLEIV